MSVRPNPFIKGKGEQKNRPMATQSVEHMIISDSMDREQQPPNLSYSLIRLRPKPKRFNEEQQQPETASKKKNRLSRWLFVYLPLLGLFLIVLYLLFELLIKHIALRTVRDQISMLPETIEHLPVAPTPSVPSMHRNEGNQLPPMMLGTTGHNRSASNLSFQFYDPRL